MSEISTMEGVTSSFVQTGRLRTHVLSCGFDEGTPVVFLHGNFSAATYWEETMLALPAGFRAIAPDLRGYGWTEDKLIDATRGMGDWSADLAALLDALNIDKAHLVGWSLGGGVLYRFLSDHPARALSVTLISPVSASMNSTRCKLYQSGNNTISTLRSPFCPMICATSDQLPVPVCSPICQQFAAYCDTTTVH